MPEMPEIVVSFLRGSSFLTNYASCRCFGLPDNCRHLSPGWSPARRWCRSGKEFAENVQSLHQSASHHPDLDKKGHLAVSDDHPHHRELSRSQASSAPGSSIVCHASSALTQMQSTLHTAHYTLHTAHCTNAHCTNAHCTTAQSSNTALHCPFAPIHLFIAASVLWNVRCNAWNY